MDEITRAVLLVLLERGEITMSEASDLACVNRSSILKMCRKAGIDPVSRRLDYFTRRFAKVSATIQGEELRPPSKSAISARAAALVRRWEDEGSPKRSERRTDRSSNV